MLFLLLALASHLPAAPSRCVVRTMRVAHGSLCIRKSTNAKLKRYAKLTGETMISVVDLLITAELERYDRGANQTLQRSGTLRLAA